MPAETVSYNAKLLPDDSPSLFRQFVHAQDEIAGSTGTEAIKPDNILTEYFPSESIIQIRMQGQNPLKSSVFSGHLLKAEHREAIPFQHHTEEWMLAVMLPVLLLAIVIKLFYHNRLVQVFRAFVTYKHMNQLMREGNILNERITPPLVLLYFISTTLIAFQSLKLAGVTTISRAPDYLLLLYLFAGITCISMIRILIIRILGWIFKTREYSQTYIVNTLVFYGVIGFVLLLFVLPAFYTLSEWRVFAVIAAMAGLLITMIYGIVRGFIIGLGIRKYSWLYLFLYLCTVEFLPFLVIGKLAASHFFTLQ